MLEPGKIYQLKEGRTYPCFILKGVSLSWPNVLSFEISSFLVRLQNREKILTLQNFEIELYVDLSASACKILILDTEQVCYIFCGQKAQNKFLREFEEVVF